MTRHVSENTRKIACMCIKYQWHKMHVNLPLCASWFARTAHMHLWFAQTALVHFGLHELHLCILVLMSTHVFPTHFACFLVCILAWHIHE